MLHDPICRARLVLIENRAERIGEVVKMRFAAHSHGVNMTDDGISGNARMEEVDLYRQLMCHKPAFARATRNFTGRNDSMTEMLAGT